MVVAAVGWLAQRKLPIRQRRSVRHVQPRACVRSVLRRSAFWNRGFSGFTSARRSWACETLRKSSVLWLEDSSRECRQTKSSRVKRMDVCLSVGFGGVRCVVVAV